MSLAFLVMASSFPCGEIRQLLGHVYVFFARRGRPVKKLRLIPGELAQQWARKLRDWRLGTISVL